jgi:hypothetical protein
MLTEERFQHKAPVDKRGRKVRLANLSAATALVNNNMTATVASVAWSYRPDHYFWQVKVERKNEDLHKYYRLGVQVRFCPRCLSGPTP